MLKIRQFEWKDVDALNERVNDPEVQKYLTTSKPFSLEETVQYFATRMEHNDVVLVAEVDGKVAGSVEIRRERGKASHVGVIAIAVKKEFWGQKIGTKLLEKAIKEAKDKGFKKVVYGVFEPNERSIKLIEQFSFRQVGRMEKQVYIDGKYYDELIFEKLL